MVEFLFFCHIFHKRDCRENREGGYDEFPPMVVNILRKKGTQEEASKGWNRSVLIAWKTKKENDRTKGRKNWRKEEAWQDKKRQEWEKNRGAGEKGCWWQARFLCRFFLRFLFLLLFLDSSWSLFCPLFPPKYSPSSLLILRLLGIERLIHFLAFPLRLEKITLFFYFLVLYSLTPFFQ